MEQENSQSNDWSKKNKNLRRQRNLLTVFLILLVIVIGFLLWGIFSRGSFYSLFSFIATPTFTNTPNPPVTFTPIPSVTITQIPTATLTPVPSETPTPAPSSTATSFLDDLTDYEKDCLEWGVVNYIVTGEDREKAYIAWIDGGDVSDTDVYFIPRCIRYANYPSGASMYVSVKAFNSSADIPIKCQIYHFGELVAEDSASEAGQTIECKAKSK